MFAYCLPRGAGFPARVQLTSTPAWSGRAALGAAGEEIMQCAQAGRTTPLFANVDPSTAHASDVNFMSVSRADAPPPGPLSLRAFDPGLAELGFAAMRDRFAEERPTPSIEYEGQNLLLLYGDLHDHTEISQCNRRGDLTPDDNYAHNRDIHRLDFAAVTDHGYNITPAIWRLTGKTARYNHDPGRFVTFLGEEWTSTNEKKSPEHPEGYYGHRNLIFADPYFPRWFNARDDGTPAQIWADLRKDNANFVQIPHQLADTGNVPTDWNFVDEVAQPVAEIFQARESYEYEGSPRQAKNTISGHFIQDAWAKGIVIGVIASPDHGGGKGKACIYAPERTREAILDAIRARHTYGTTCAKIFLDFRVNGRLMGEKLPGHEGKPVTIQVRAEGAGDIERIDICRNNEFVFTREIGGPAAEFEYKDEDPPAGPTYYYARVVQVDQELAWSSPVWLGAE